MAMRGNLARLGDRLNALYAHFIRGDTFLLLLENNHFPYLMIKINVTLFY